MKPPHRRRPKFTSAATRPNDTAAAVGAAIGAALASHRRGAFRLSPFLPGAYLHVDVEDPALLPDVRAVMGDVAALFGVLTTCGIEERRRRLRTAPGDGLSLGPLAAPYVLAFDKLAEVSEQLARVNADPFRGLLDPARADHNRRVLRDLTLQVGHMHAALLLHCADATDVPADFAEARLNDLATLFDA